MNQQTTNSSSFHGLGIAPAMLDILEKNKFVTPTPIQAQAIPIATQGKDVMGVAQTGTGKTLAFGIPMIQRLSETGGIGLVVLPTRELALQVDEVLRKIGESLHLRTAVLIGGAPFPAQVKSIHRKPHIVIGTPGRIIDHIKQRTLKLDIAKIVVLDEADRMLDMGFLPQIRDIFKVLPTARQTMLFSATMPRDIVHMATSYMQLPIRVEIAPTGTTSERVVQELLIVDKSAKPYVLKSVLERFQSSTLVFTRTKFGAKRLARELHEMGYTTAEIHSNRSLAQRREALEGFKKGKYRVLVATDIAARGIDVKNIELVVNYDLPSTAEDYVHRIGRTARAGAGGHAISFAMPDERKDVRDIERLINMQIAVSKHSPLTEFTAYRPNMRGGKRMHFSSRRYRR